MTMCLAPNGWNRSLGAAAPTRLLVGTTQGVDVLDRDGPRDLWRAAGRTLAGVHVASLAREPKLGGIFAGTHGQGLYFSADEGRHWERLTRGLTLDEIYSVGYAQQDGRTVIYAGTEPASLFRSLDYGQSWEELPALRQMPGHEKWSFPPPPHIAHTKSLTVDPRDGKVIYAAIEQGAFLKSIDGGQSWREFEGYSRDDDFVYRDIHQVLLRPSNPDQLYMTTGVGLYFSPDGGETWEKLTGRDCRVGYPDQIAFAPDDENTLFMAGAAKAPNAWMTSHHAAGTVLRSRDGGRHWEIADRGLPTETRANIEALGVAAYPDGYALFAGDTDGDVYCSEDGGDSWQRIGSALGAVSKAGHYQLLQRDPATAA
jgi:photosystem II stability/assembly factor-like uncharacterized protein